MASVPNTRIAASPVPTGKSPATAATADPADFAGQLAGIPLELVRVAAETLSGGNGDTPSSDDAAATGDEKPKTASGDTPSEADKLAALTPMPQPLPALLPLSVLAPASAPVPADVPTVEVAADATVKSQGHSAAMPAPVPAARTAAAANIPRVAPDATKDEAEPETSSDGDGQPAPAASDRAARETSAKNLLAAARSAIEAALRPAKPATAAEPAVKAVQPATPGPAPAAPPSRDAQASTPIADALPAPDSIVSSACAGPAPSAPVSAPSQSGDSTPPAPQRSLDIANDNAWLDRLAHDIAQAAGNEGAIRFRLHPETLGHLRVELSQGEHGTAVRLTADTEQARAILADAQPRLVAEARAQGVRIAETHVDLSGSDRQPAGDPRRQDDPRQTPIIRTARAAAGEADAPARPTRSRSDRYA